jgi:hypothetical protein
MGSTWFDYTGESTFWNNIPLRTVKKAFFRKGSLVRSLSKMVLNSTTYDFRETATGGAVIVPPGYSAIEFISPDGRIDYNSLLEGSFGNALYETVTVLENNPVPAWDKFAKWFGSVEQVPTLMNNVASCKIQTIAGDSSMAVDIPDFSGIRSMADILRAMFVACSNAHSQSLSKYRLDNAAFGWATNMTSFPDENGNTRSITIGFLFRE